MIFVQESTGDCILEPSRLDVKGRQRQIVGNESGVAEAFDELASNASVQGRHETKPQAGQSRSPIQARESSTFAARAGDHIPA